jgi:ferrous iron transport protein A
MTEAATLNLLKPGETGKVARLATPDLGLMAKLREIGFSEGDEVELITHGPFGGQPIAVRLNRTLIALRRIEAQAIEVERRHG